MITKRQGRWLAALLLATVLALNFPTLTIVEAAQAASGTAWIPIYVFGVWGLAILAAALILERRDP
ncbi:MAG TPA: hypothetical protein PKA13_25300 [Geminicoccaceae bacterium]|nr:hypothetical protein [Geminicoccus sp.]HMU53114.1 hypothetical protein [Geminicoccaceae bacterium]